VHPVGSYCTDISRCTVNKTLNSAVLFSVASKFEHNKIYRNYVLNKTFYCWAILTLIIFKIRIRAGRIVKSWFVLKSLTNFESFLFIVCFYST